MLLIDRARALGRPVLLVLLGAMLGAALVVPVSASVRNTKVQAATMYTRAASCSGASFHPVDSDTTYVLFHTEIYSTTTAPATFVCDPGLPNKAVVTKVQFTVLDNSLSGYEVKFCALVRTNLEASSATTLLLMAQVPSTGAAPSPGVVRLTTASINHAAIDNTRFGYYLTCQLTGPTYNTGHDNLGIYGASVTYTISAANG